MSTSTFHIFFCIVVLFLQLMPFLVCRGFDNVVGVHFCMRYHDSIAFIMPYLPHKRFHVSQSFDIC